MATYKLTKKTDANGTTADMLLSAESIEKDTTVTSGSSKPVTSGAVSTALGNKQDTLVSGINIKTINNTSLLGSGNITISSVSITSATLTLVE